MFPQLSNIQTKPMLLIPAFPAHIRFFSMNSNTSLPSSLPKSFPIPMEGRDDFFCVDPKSLRIEQLNEYKKEMIRLSDIEKNNLERITHDSNTRINAYNQGISLAQETIKTNSKHPQTVSPSIFLPNFKPDDDGPIGCIDPKTLTITQLQLYIEGIHEEISYEEKLIDEFKKESTSRIQAYQTGIQRADYELNIRQGK